MNKITNLGKIIYTGKVYKLYDNSSFFIITDTQDNILFYQEYQIINISRGFKSYDKKIFNVRQIYQLKTRENVSNNEHKKLFSKLVHSLLFLGYILQDDTQHTLLSKNSIETLYNTGELVLYYGPLNDVKVLSPGDFDKVFDGNINTNLYYVNKDVSKNNILENTINENYQSRWVNNDLFDDISEYLV